MKLTPFICAMCGYATSTAGPGFVPSCPNHGGAVIVMMRAKIMTTEDFQKEQENNATRPVHQ